jgi:hypothetical protein
MKFLAPLQNIAPQHFVKDLAKILSRGRNFGPGAEFPALKHNFWPCKKQFPGDFEPFYSSPLFQTSLHHQSCAIPRESLQCLAQD